VISALVVINRHSIGAIDRRESDGARTMPRDVGHSPPSLPVCLSASFPPSLLLPSSLPSLPPLLPSSACLLPPLLPSCLLRPHSLPHSLSPTPIVTQDNLEPQTHVSRRETGIVYQQHQQPGMSVMSDNQVVRCKCPHTHTLTPATSTSWYLTSTSTARQPKYYQQQPQMRMKPVSLHLILLAYQA
jgi:hypothetical protein